MKDRLATFFATACYVGMIPGAPGTYASIVTTLIYSFVHRLGGRIVPELHLSVICLITVIGVVVSARVSRLVDNEDPSIVVIDEVAGQLLTFLFLPVNLWILIGGTFLFRVFDIWKPFPVRNLEPLKNGVGIMADDIAAGIYANLILQVAVRLIPW